METEPSTWIVDFDLVAIAGQMFVDGIVEDFENAMMQPAFVGVADVHAGAFPDGFQAFEFIDFCGVVFLVR